MFDRVNITIKHQNAGNTFGRFFSMPTKGLQSLSEFATPTKGLQSLRKFTSNSANITIKALKGYIVNLGFTSTYGDNVDEDDNIVDNVDEDDDVVRSSIVDNISAVQNKPILLIYTNAAFGDMYATVRFCALW